MPLGFISKTGAKPRCAPAKDLQPARAPKQGLAGVERDLVVDLDPFVFNGAVEGFLTRLSGTSLANVTSGGGQVPAFLVEPIA